MVVTITIMAPTSFPWAPIAPVPLVQSHQVILTMAADGEVTLWFYCLGCLFGLRQTLLWGKPIHIAKLTTRRMAMEKDFTKSETGA